MGRDDRKEKKKNKEDAQGKDKEPPVKKPGGIPKYQFFQKASLAPYPDEDGNALWLGDKESLGDLLAPAAVLNSRTPKNAEMLARPGMALSLAASAFEHGGGDLASGKAKKALEKLVALFKEKDGQCFLDAARVLNLGKSGSASRSDVKDAVHTYVKFMIKDSEGLQGGAPW